MIRINLIKTEAKDVEVKTAVSAEPEIREKRPAPTGSLIAALIILLLLALAFFQKRAIDRERGVLGTVEEEKKTLEPVLVKLEDVENRKAFLERKIGLIKDLQVRQGDVVKFMVELSAGLPEWVWLTETTYGRQGVQIKGKALSNIQISDYMRNLERSGLFDTVALLSSTQRRQANDVFLDFTLSANFPLPQAAEPAKPPEAK